jgi:hypothetical protein
MLLDDDARASLTQTLMVLRGDVDRGLNEGSRDYLLNVARLYRQLLATAEKASEEAALEVQEAMDKQRARVVQFLGTSAWDEPEPPPKLSALPAAPLRQLSLNELIAARDFFANLPDGSSIPAANAGEVALALSEAIRLRSDEWLRAATEEIAAAERDTMRVIGRRETEAASPSFLLRILRKHRDGKA